jgi:hypothetical protein
LIPQAVTGHEGRDDRNGLTCRRETRQDGLDGSVELDVNAALALDLGMAPCTSEITM